MCSVPRVLRGWHDLIMAGNAEREFDHVEPSDIERPGAVEPFQHRTSNIGNEVGANL